MREGGGGGEKPVGGGGRETGGSWIGYGYRGWVEREIGSREMEDVRPEKI